MKVIKTAEEFKQIRKSLENKSVGFVPTMGGLHNGHLSLIQKAIKENDVMDIAVSKRC